MKIEFFYSHSCTKAEKNFERLTKVAANLVPDSPVHKLKIQPEVLGEKSAFYRSSSIYINGEILELDKRDSHDMSHPAHKTERAIPTWLIEAGILRTLNPKGLLFLCVANSARSQIGEGIAHQLAPSDVLVQSAGSHPTSVRPEATIVLSELGIDTSKHTSKNVSEIAPNTVDTVITLCNEEECPTFLGKAHRIHWGLPDPAHC